MTNPTTLAAHIVPAEGEDGRELVVIDHQHSPDHKGVKVIDRFPYEPDLLPADQLAEHGWRTRGESFSAGGGSYIVSVERA